MLTNTPNPDSPPPSDNSFHRAYSAIVRRAHAGFRSAVKVFRDPVLPWLLLGAIAAAFVAAFVLDAPPAIVFGILCIGFLTAIVETKTHNENPDL